VCSCKQSKSTAWARSMYCMETVLCATVGRASQEHGLEAFTVYGRSETMLKNEKAVLNLSAVSHLVQNYT
jgi:hypothetical protein